MTFRTDFFLRKNAPLYRQFSVHRFSIHTKMIQFSTSIGHVHGFETNQNFVCRWVNLLEYIVPVTIVYGR